MVEDTGLLNKMLNTNGSDDAKFKSRNKSSKSAKGWSVCSTFGTPGHYEHKCWQKFPRLKPKGRKDVSDIEKEQGS